MGGVVSRDINVVKASACSLPHKKDGVFFDKIGKRACDISGASHKLTNSVGSWLGEEGVTAEATHFVPTHSTLPNILVHYTRS